MEVLVEEGEVEEGGEVYYSCALGYLRGLPLWDIVCMEAVECRYSGVLGL